MNSKSAPPFVKAPIVTTKADISEVLVASVSNDKIETAFKETHVFRNYLKADSVSISAKDGVVTLTGIVAEHSHKAWAEDTAAGLQGVSRVINKIETKGEAAAERSDAWVCGKVKLSLPLHRNVSAIKTTVDVERGVVTLSGEAESGAQRDIATEYARDIDGVVDVKNNMSVVAKSDKKEHRVNDVIDDASITAHVRSAPSTHSSTRCLKTNVCTNGGEVTLTGTTKTSTEKALATKVAEDIHGVSEVNNEMTVEECKTK